MTKAIESTLEIVRMGRANCRTDLNMIPTNSPIDTFKKKADKKLANMQDVPPAEMRFRLKIAG
jgi:hypothetical protein